MPLFTAARRDRVLSALRGLGLGALLGLISAGMAVGVGELVAWALRPQSAPIFAVGNKFILLTPESLKEYAIRKFGSNDKQMLLNGIYTAIAVLAVVLGVLALRRWWFGVVGLIGFGLLGAYCALTVNAAQTSDALPSLIGTVAAVLTLLVLLGLLGRGPLPVPVPGGVNRRNFLFGTAILAVAAVAGDLGGKAGQRSRFNAEKSRSRVSLPKPASPAPALPTKAQLADCPTPFVTSNDNFYRVDTALTVPQLDAETWKLRLHGKVDHEREYSFDDLLNRPLIERYITMTCVSNPVGGPYVSTAKFLGVRLSDLLREAGVHKDADQIVGKSSDGMTIGTPTSVIMDGRDAMLAVGMNDEPLPVKHGFPVRMLVPGLFGYVSATKWLVDLEATTFADYDTYWVKRKWAAKAPIRLESRIDAPRGLSSVKKGQKVAVAGIAWHQHVGISAVEVKIGDRDWAPATLGAVPNTDTWVQWTLPWTVEESGPVTLQVRARDRAGVVQEDTRRDVFPSGASGWHSVVVIAG